MRKRKETIIGVTFWGTRGSIPTPGRQTLRYGGNTPCVEIRSGNDFLILDAGTGIRKLGENRPFVEGAPIPVLITHPHADHIAGLPFFAPALKKGTRLEIFGPPGLKKSLERLFPFSVLPCGKRVTALRPGRLRIASFEVDACRVNHPGCTLGYRILSPSGRKIVYISDHEASPSHGKLAEWISRADLLIMDAQYFDEEYRRHRGWGHSSFTATVRLALKGGVKRLVLYHHDPGHSDAVLEKKLDRARALVGRSHDRMPCLLAREGQTLMV